jgi:hypothetical protein
MGTCKIHGDSGQACNKRNTSNHITSHHPIQYTSGIGDICQKLPCHIQRLVGLDEWDDETPHDIIVATDGSVLLWVGYHSWVVASENEHILVSGGGDQLLTPSYRSELGGIANRLAVIGRMARSGKVKV